MRGTVLETFFHDGAPAAATGLPLLAVGVERLGEISALAVDVDVLPVKAGAPVVEGLAKNVPNRVEQFAAFLYRHRRAVPIAVETHPPQGFVGVNVSHAADQALVQ